MQVYKVSEYIDLINETLRQEIAGDEIMVEGEVSDFTVSHGKWVNFSLKDEEAEAVLKCFMTTFQLSVPVEDGMKIRVSAVPKIYPRFGNFSLNVSSYELVGEGALRRAFELLKARLTEEGFFATERKRMIPRFPVKIGVITSREAAAYTDFVRILNNRWSGIDVELTSVHVQGRDAVSEIVGAFGYFNSVAEADRPDVLVLTRGGGSLEDLQAFNSEKVVRAVFGSKVPVVCAVGHERDESLADYAADVRASTPSNAAEMVVPDRREVLYEIETMQRHIVSKIEDKVGDYDFGIDRAINYLETFLSSKIEFFERTVQGLSRAAIRFESQVKDTEALLEEKTQRIISSSNNWLEGTKDSVTSFVRLLNSVNPENILKRGYSIIKKKGKIIKSIKQISVGDTLRLQMSEGGTDARVSKIYDTSKKKQSKIQFRKGV